ncbi:hypothetical protein ElyMa_005825600 [Elysia marginata]|uniref:Uncharacterized protein n=1 Tax=Elysia marginata TaxID=1093978 RepID=A0AAV4FWH5_9GAST|nr:hypothetical protein ElyMa_005825600 [Elysia marginata]
MNIELPMTQSKGRGREGVNIFTSAIGEIRIKLYKVSSFDSLIKLPKKGYTMVTSHIDVYRRSCGLELKTPRKNFLISGASPIEIFSSTNIAEIADRAELREE